MKATDVSVFGVIGAGQMGGGIAQVAAQAGLEVRLSDVSRQALDAAVGRIDYFLGRQQQKGGVTADEKAKAEKEARAIKKMIEIGILRRDVTEEAYTIDRVIEAALPYDTLLALHDVLYNAPDSNTKPDDDDEGDQ